MPWTYQSAEEHIKGLSDIQAKAWAKIANNARSSCIANGGSEQMCDAQAIATANKMAKRVKEAQVDVLKELEKTMLEEATWDTAYQNSLPDSAFLYISHGGTKDSDGNTLPRTNRYFPVYDDTGKVDLPHLRNALARIPQSSLDQSVKDAVTAKAEKLAKANLPSQIAASDQEIKGDFEPLEEKAVGEDGSILVKCIGPGWGSSGYYSPDVLSRDIAAYKSGTKMFWDHPTAQEARDRPERSLRDLAGEFTEDGKYMADGPKGPGVYARAKVFAPYKAFVDELAPHIGASHRALGTKVNGEAEGRRGPIIEKIEAVQSVDFVTAPGAKGEIVQMFEAARDTEYRNLDWRTVTLEALKSNRGDLIEGLRDEMKQAIYDEKNALKEAERMTEERIAELEEANRQLQEGVDATEAELARLREAEILRQAKDIVTEKVNASELPDITKARLTETISKNPTLTEDGALDTENYSQHIDEAIKAEMDYVAKLTESGKIKGMGTSEDPSGKDLMKESFKRGYKNRGMSEDEADRLADIAARGR